MFEDIEDIFHRIENLFQAFIAGTDGPEVPDVVLPDEDLHHYIDVLDQADFIFQVEEEFEVEIPDEVSANLWTIHEIVEAVEARQG